MFDQVPCPISGRIVRTITRISGKEMKESRMDVRRLNRLLVAILLVALAPVPATADGFDGQRFTPAAGAAGGFWLERPLIQPHLGWSLGMFLHYADDPVVLDSDAGVVARPLERALTLDLLGSIGLFEFAELAVHLPVHVVYTGDATLVGGDALVASEGIGDLRFVPKVRLRRGRALGLALALPISLPTGDDLALRGASDVTIEPRLLMSYWPGGRLAFGANLGYRLHTSAAGRQGPGGDELTFGAGLRYRPAAASNIVLSAELAGGLTTADGGTAFRQVPLEGLLGAIFEVAPHWHLYAGGGVGLLDGVGTPDFRAIVGIRYTSVSLSDRDGDGIVDERDLAPDDPEDLDGYQDHDGVPEEGGPNDADTDGDGIIDRDDECPTVRGPPGGDGCPERGRAVYRDGRIRLLGKIRFKTNSAELLPSSDPILDDVATAMKRNRGIRKVRVEGHSDNVGDPGYNKKLSQERARSVRQALIKRGVSPRRLEAVGHGEARPIATNRTERGRAKNRRVEFQIVK
jgi:outer membrane protein OmpA-like peptidoglycan-associated protein